MSCVPRRWTPYWCFAAAALLGISGCSPFRRVGDCKRVIGAINPKLDEIEALTPDAGASPTRYEKIAARYGEIDEELGRFELTDPKLKSAVDDYRGLLSATAEQCRAMASELRRGAESRSERTTRNRQLRQVRMRARRNVANQAAMVHALNDACRAK